MTQRWAAAPTGSLVFATTAIPVGDRAAGRFRAAAPFSQDLRGLLGFANAPRGADGVIRHMRPVLPAADGGYLPSFAVATLAAYERHSAKALQRALADRGGRLTLPLGEPSRGVARSEEISVATLADTVWRIDFAGSPDSFAAFPAGPLIRLARSGVRPDTDNPFRGRIVLVGATFEATGDVYPTPVGLMRGVEIQANALHTLLARRALLPPHWAVNLGLMIAVCLWVTLLSLRLSGVWVAVITEIKVGKGAVEVKPVGGRWRAAGPLQAVRAGDEIRTTENAAIVVVLTSGRGVVRIDARNSPWAAPAVSEIGKVTKAEALVSSGLSYLIGTAQDAPDVLLSTRAGGSPRIISPRDGPVLGTPVVFEWAGSHVSRSTVRVTSPTGVILERTGITGARFVYPDDAPALTAGIRYTLEVTVRSDKLQTTTFEIVDAVRLAAIRAELADLEAVLGATGTPSSTVAVKAGALASMGLLYDARLVVLAALAADPDEPTLHAILGTLYSKTGLPEHAAAAFGEANLLLGHRR